MANLSHWAFAKDFTVHEAAYLILGVDPSTDTDGRSVRHIKERMNEAYDGALNNLRFQFFVEPCLPDSWLDNGTQTVDPKLTLISVEMEKLSEGHRYGDEVSTEAWLERGRISPFEQRFSRAEIARWLDESQLVSAYPFVLDSAPKLKVERETSVMEKPLSNRERDTLLTIIAALCKEAKIPYDKPAKAAGMIQSTAATMGVAIGETTIEGHLKKIPDALATRMK
jgi:hypothetical protein